MTKPILGIDVGGTKIAAGLVDQKLRVSQVSIIPTSQKDLVRQIIDLIKSYSGFSGIGLAIPGPVLASGLVTHLPNIKNFKPTNFKKLLEKKFSVFTSVVNDAKSFALAEATVGQGKNFKIVAGVILGTGIGVGFIGINKKIYYGRNSLAGEIGHFLMPDGKFFEQYVKAAGKFKTAKDASKYLRMLLSFIVRSIDPEVIIFGGGWSRLKGMNQALRQALKQVRLPVPKTVIKISKLKHASIIGAALLALQR